MFRKIKVNGIHDFKAQEDRHIVSMFRIGMFPAHQVFIERRVHNGFDFPWQCSIERDGDFGALNGKTEYRNRATSFFQISADSICRNLMVLYVSAGSEETASCLLVFNVSIGDLHYV